MVMLSMLIWWYTQGWRRCAAGVMGRLDATMDYFSIGLLVTTLFAPFRQISAGSVRGSLEVQMRAFFDRLISRFIGMLARLVLITAGSVIIVLNILIGAVAVLFWAFVPLLPLIGLTLFLLEWMPWSS